MKRYVQVVSLMAIGILAAATPAAAKVQRLDRSPDRVANHCAQNNSPAKCAPIAVGDLNGDGRTDAVFVRIGQFNQRSLLGTLERSLDIVFGPFAAVGDTGAKADATVTISAAGELPSIIVADFDGDGVDDLVMAEAERSLGTEIQRVAVLRGGEGLRGDFWMGAADRGDFRLTRTVPLGPLVQQTTGGIRLHSVLSPRLDDIDGDGKADLLLAVDPPTLSANGSKSAIGRVAEVSAESPSHILVFRDAPALALRAGGDLALNPGDEDVNITGLGACTASGLLGIGDVTGDGLPDIFVRRCPGGGVPDMPGLVPGRRDWPSGLTIDGAVKASPRVLPPGPEPTADPGRPEDPPRGYVAFTPLPKSLFDRPTSSFIQDVNQDGVLDLGFGFSDKTHVWLGGRNVAAHIKANRSDRVYLQAGFGGTSVSGSWQVTDLTGDGVKDLILTQRSGAAIAAADRPVPAPIVLGGGAIDAPRPGAVTGGGREVQTEPVKIYAGARTGKDILNLAEDEPDAIWQDQSLDLWLIGDFNGDGHDDLMMGSPGQSSSSAYQVYFGPFTN